jgi:hypothetical protein
LWQWMKTFQGFIEAKPPAPYRTMSEGICAVAPIETNSI